MTLPPALDPLTDEVAQAALAEVQFLAEQRLGIVRSPGFTADVLATYDQRLEASLDALLVRGPQIVPWLVSILTTAETPGDICGIAVALLEARDPQAAEGLLQLLAAAEEGPKRRGLLMALRRGPIELLVPALQKWLASESPRQVIAAAEVLGSHGRLEQPQARLNACCIDGDPQIRQAAWRAVALLPGKPAETP
jgi:hypothetical protein